MVFTKERWRLPQLTDQPWKEVLPFGFVITGSVMLMRGIGWLQIPELMVLDRFMSIRPTEAVSEHVVLVGITEDDLKQHGGFPLADQTLSDALTKLEAASPQAIGLDLFRDISSDPQHLELQKYLARSQKLIGAKVVLNADDTLNIPAPPELPPEQTGFADVILDSDHKLRRMILASRTWSGALEYSLSTRLVMAALKAEGIPFKHGERSTDPLQLGAVVLPRVTERFGGYQSIDANGHQILLNFSTGAPPFLIFSLSEVLSSEFDLSQVRDKIVLVGMTAASVKDFFYSDAVPHSVLTQQFGNDESFQSRLYGVEYHAHTVHQLLASIESGRPNLWTFPMWLDLALMLGAGGIGIGIGLWLRSPWRSLLALASAFFILGSVSMVLLISVGLWLPSLPLALILACTGLSTAFVDRDLQRLSEERRKTITNTYESVHNGPLQTLAIAMREVQESQLSSSKLALRLQDLNQELRELYDHMQTSALESSETLYLQSNERLSLDLPLEQLLHIVYSTTLERPFVGFESLVVQLTPDFSGLEGQAFSLSEKRGLCLFLEEALNNVGKHGVSSTSLEVSCLVQNHQFQLKVINRFSSNVDSGSYCAAGYGTQQSEKLARMLHGKFQRIIEDQQFICHLTWPVKRSRLANWISWYHRIFSS